MRRWVDGAHVLKGNRVIIVFVRQAEACIGGIYRKQANAWVAVHVFCPKRLLLTLDIQPSAGNDGDCCFAEWLFERRKSWRLGDFEVRVMGKSLFPIFCFQEGRNFWIVDPLLQSAFCVGW